MQIQGSTFVIFSEATKNILKDFINKIKNNKEELDTERKKQRLAHENYQDFKKVINEGYVDWQ